MLTAYATWAEWRTERRGWYKQNKAEAFGWPNGYQSVGGRPLSLDMKSFADFLLKDTGCI